MFMDGHYRIGGPDGKLYLPARVACDSHRLDPGIVAAGWGITFPSLHPR